MLKLVSIRQAMHTAWLTVGLITLGLVGSASAQERETVELVTLNWPPYYGEELPDGGFVTTVAREAFARSGYDMEVTFVPWARAMAQAEAGNADGLLGAYHNERRAEKFRFSEALYNDHVGFIALADSGIESYDTLRDLEGYTVGLGRGFTVSPAFDNADYIDKDPARNNEVNIHKLFAGRVDLVVESWFVIANRIEELGYPREDVVFVEPPVATNGLYVALSRELANDAELIAAFNEGLAEMRADGTYDDLRERFDMPPEGVPAGG